MLLFHHKSHTDRPGIEFAFYGKRRISTLITRVSQRSPSGIGKGQPTASQPVSFNNDFNISFRQQQNKADSFHLPLPYGRISGLHGSLALLHRPPSCCKTLFYVNQRHSHVYEWETCFNNFDVINLKTLQNKTASAKPVLADMKFTSQFIQSVSHCWRSRGTVCVTSSNKRTQHTNYLFNINNCRQT